MWADSLVMTKPSLEELFQRYRDGQDLEALGVLFDRSAPQLQKLARRLAGSQADDVLQETYLRVLEKADAWDKTRPVLPWMVGILVHRAQHAWRAKQRRPDPERVEVRETREPFEDLVQREQNAQLLRAVEQLSPPLRHAVQGALFDGRTPTQLAVDLGLRPGTIRQRLRRGLTQLRVALQASMIWLVGLLGLRSTGLASVRASVLQQAAAASNQAFVASSATGIRWAVAIAIVASLGWVGRSVWKSGEQESPARADDTALVGLPQDPSSTSSVAAASMQDLDRGERQIEAGRLNLAVQVLWLGSDEPVPGREVTLWLQPHRKVTTISGDNGLAVFELEIGEIARSGEVAAAAESPQVRFDLFAGDATQPHVVHVHRGGSLSGQVFDENDQPVAFAEVQGWCRSRLDGPPDRQVRADEEGRFEVTGLGDKFYLLAQMDQRVASRGLQGKVQPGESLTGHRLDLAPADQFAGVVLLPDGAPAAGAAVVIQHQTGSSGPQNQTHDAGVYSFPPGAGEARTSAEGEFAIGGLPPGQQYVQVTLAPYLTYGEHHEVGSSDLVIELDPGDQLQGEIVDSNGLPIPDAEIRVWPKFSNLHNFPIWTRAQKGRFSLVGLSHHKGRYGVDNVRGLLVRAPGYAIHALEPLPENLRELEPLRIALLPEQSISGRVMNADGTPAVGKLVRCVGDRELEMNVRYSTPHTWERVAQRNEVRTDLDGSFAFPQLYSGLFEVTVFADDQQELHVSQTVRSGTKPIHFELDPIQLQKVVLRLTVTDGLTKQPIPEPVLGLFDGDTGMHRSLRRSAGHWVAEGIDPGEVTIQVAAKHYISKKLAPKWLAEGVHEVAVELLPMRTLEVHAQDSTGAPIQRVDVRGVGPDGRDIHFVISSATTTTRASLRANSPFLHGIPAGPVSLTLDNGDTSKTVSLDLTRPRSEPLRITLDLAQVSQKAKVSASLLVMEWCPAEKLKEGEVPTIPFDAPMPSTGGPEAIAFFRKVRGGRLQFPSSPFRMTVRRPDELRPVQVTYRRRNAVLDGSMVEGDVSTTERSDPNESHQLRTATEVDWESKPFELEVAWDQGFMHMGNLTYWDPAENVMGAPPMELSFPTFPGTCSLQLESEDYEAVEFVWEAGERDPVDMPPIILLKRKEE